MRHNRWSLAKGLRVTLAVVTTVVAAVALQVSPVNPFAEPEPAFATVTCPDRLVTFTYNGNRDRAPYGLVASGGGYEVPAAGSTVNPGSLGCGSPWRVDGPPPIDGYLVFDYGANVFDVTSGVVGDTVTLTFDIFIGEGGGIKLFALDLTSGTPLPLTAGAELVSIGYLTGYGADRFVNNASNHVVTVWTPTSTQKANLLAGGKMAILMVAMGVGVGTGYDTVSNVVLSDYSTVINYTVTFDPNLGTGSMSDQRASSAANLSANAFTRDGYRFTGWNTEALGTGTPYADSASYPFTASTTLFAQWIPEYTVTFDPNQGAGSMSAQNAIAAENLSANTFTRDGYRFAGWNTEALGTGTAYADSASYPFTASTTLFAQWVSDVTVTSISQTSGSSSGGTNITITGTNFASGATVTVGGAPCTSVVVVSSTSITCVTPSGLPGTSADVIVTNSDSGTATLSGAYDYVADPVTTLASLVMTGLNSWNSVLGALAAAALIIIAFGAFSARSRLRFAGSRAKLISILRRGGLGD
jgi:uncharacterized repeat protein (TIGR02543 family)